MLGICFGHDKFAYSRNEWAYMLDSMGVTDVWEHSADELIEGYPKSTLIESATELPDVSLVVLSPQDARQLPGEICLYDFIHPGEVIYITGANNAQLDPEFLGDRKFASVYIPAETHELFALTAMSMALYDRRCKAWAT